jgi:eukaryotic-like serine/threonine-protein kinase
MAVSFDFKKRLGSGHFGEVWRVIDTGLGCEVALKCIPPDKIVNQSNFFQEAQILKAAEHANIVHVNDTGTLDDGRIYVSMEYLERGSLEDEAAGAPLGLTRAKRVMVDVLRGLSHAHSRNIVHRDIKPANILIGNSEEAKLSDFGLALPDIQNLNISQLKQYQYVLHLAPEVRRLQDYTPLSDVYASGVTLYRLVNGDSNLPQVTPMEAHLRARRGEFPPRDKYRDFVPQGLRRVINKSISAAPRDRYQSADEMRHAIESLKLLIDWTESSSASGVIWRGQNPRSGDCFEISKTAEANLKWTVQTRRGRSGNALRRVGAYSFHNLNRSSAASFARRILQAISVGKIFGS